MRGVKARLTATILGLVAVTAAVLGIGSYVAVDLGLHDQALSSAAEQARFDLSVLIPERLPADPTIDDVVASRLGETFRQRGVETIVDLHDDQVYVSNGDLAGALSSFPQDLRRRVGGGELAYAWTTLGTAPLLVVGGRIEPTLDVYFVHDIGFLEATLARLRLALGLGALVLVLVALLVAQALARGVLAPVEAASHAAERIERGDLAARVTVASRDEFGTWAERFNRMAETLGQTITRLEAAQTQNRRFVADVSHELRTPLAALVAEASILRDHLDALPPGSRRAAELLVDDVGRLRSLVDDLMELSRFDADAEAVALEPVNVGRLVRAIVDARLKDASLRLPPEPVLIETDPRRIERILGNVLDNAREHAQGSPVDVDLTTDEKAVVLAVADRGPGIAADRLERIFERFYKAEPSRHAGSSGLGLAIAREHALLLGGSLEAANRDDGGLRVELRIPVTESLHGRDLAAIPTTDADDPDLAQESSA